MYGLAQIYNCCRCGETWRVSSAEIIDTENDRVETVLYCDVCGSEVGQEKKENGLPCLHSITEEEHLELSGFYDTQNDIDEEFDDIDFYL